MTIRMVVFLICAPQVLLAYQSDSQVGTPSNLTVDDIYTAWGRKQLIEKRLEDIVPGTKWCGAGNIARSKDDLGILRELDACCRSHDLCPQVIRGKTTSETFNLTNKYKYTKTSCECNSDFYKCLHNLRIDIVPGTIVGHLFFDYTGNPCFSFEHPAKCNKLTWPRIPFTKIFARCKRYKVDTSKPKLWQWFDLPKWSTLIRNWHLNIVTE